MTTASEQAAASRLRAETYLRLQAEAELRRALSFPKYRPLSQRRRRHGFVMLRRRVRARRMLRYSGREEGRGGTFLPGRAGTALRWSAQVPGQILAAGGGLARGSLWRVRRSLDLLHGRSDDPPRAHECLDRLADLGSALVAAGAIDEATGAAVVTDLRTSLAVRSRIDPAELAGWPGWPPQGSRIRPAAGPLGAIPVGVPARCEIDGQPVRIYLGTLLFDRGEASLTMHARLPEGLEQRAGRRRPALMEALEACTAADDGGRRYRADFSGGGGGGSWDGRFGLHPVPPASCRWLDFTLPGAEPIRLRLDTSPPGRQVSTTPLPPGEQADRFVDRKTTELLLAGWAQGDDLRDDAGAIGVAAGLLAAGVLSPASPSLGRLAAAAARLRLRLPAPLAGIEAGTLPADWLSLLAPDDSEDGADGMIPVAAVLPEVDGVRCVVTDLVADQGSASIGFHARGWPQWHHHRWARPPETFRWTARDDAGGWYLGAEGSGSWGNDVADLEIEFQPALSARARELQLILTGVTSEATVTVPLTWQEGP